jgi:hypothetical protein
MRRAIQFDLKNSILCRFHSSYINLKHRKHVCLYLIGLAKKKHRKHELLLQIDEQTQELIMKNHIISMDREIGLNYRAILLELNTLC